MPIHTTRPARPESFTSSLMRDDDDDDDDEDSALHDEEDVEEEEEDHRSSNDSHNSDSTTTTTTTTTSSSGTPSHHRNTLSTTTTATNNNNHLNNDGDGNKDGRIIVHTAHKNLTPTTTNNTTATNNNNITTPHPSESLQFTTIPLSLVPTTPSAPAPPLPIKRKLPSGHTLDTNLAPHHNISPISPGATHYEFYDFITSAVSTSSAHTDRATGHHDAKFGGLEAHDFACKDELFFGMNQNNNTTAAADAIAAAAATEAEKDMTFLQGLKLYPKAIFWSALLSMTLVMEGYDLSIVNGFYALPEFVKRYGVMTNTGEYQITPAWQAGLTNGAVTGEILGLLLNGYLTERYGYRRCLIWALVALCAFIFLSFFAIHIQMLMASEVLCGLSWGVFQTLATTYASDVMPMTLRAYLTSNVNLCWLLGQLVGSGVLRAALQWNDEWSYRIPFGLQWMWAVPILIGTYYAPESPWWLVRHNRLDDAKKSLYRLTSTRSSVSSAKFNADSTVAMMVQTNEIERCMTTGTSYRDCFRGTDLRRTEIACMIWAIQVLCGSAMTGYATYFFTRAGLSHYDAYNLSLGMYGLAVIGQVFSWVSMRYLGRRTLYIWGCALCTVVLLAGGIVGTLRPSPTVSWTLGSLVILLTFIYDSTIGPVCYSLVAEIPSTRLRVKTVVLARVVYNLCGIVANVLMPLMLNPLAWNWRGKTCFLWAGTCALCWVWAYFRLPEPKGLTYLELDILFQKGAAARKFGVVQAQLERSGYFSIAGEGGVDRWRGSVGC